MAFFSVIFLSSCTDSKAISLKKEFKKDYYYFLALKKLDSNDEKSAKQLLKKSRSESSPTIAKLSAQILTQFGNITERNKAALYLAKKHKDDESLLLASEIFYNQEEYGKVITLTNNINISTTNNKLVFYRLNSLRKKNISQFEKSFYDWFTTRPLSSYHVTELKEYIENIQADNTSENFEFPDYVKIFNFRANVFNKNYKFAFDSIEEILSIYAKNNIPLNQQIISDIGKATLYGTDDYKSSAQYFDSFAKQIDKNLAYYAYFYSARLYDKAGRYQDLTVSRFKSALSHATLGNDYDNCLWYLLNMQLRTSIDNIIETLTNYFDKIEDPYYFDDFFESLSVLLLSHNKWQEFYNIWKIIDKKASEETATKFAYISGRLLEEELVHNSDSSNVQEIIKAFSSVINRKSNLYYKLCSMQKMNITNKKVITSILCSNDKVPQQLNMNDAGVLISGYAAFGFPQKIYGNWLNFRKSLSISDSIHASEFLSKCGSYDNSYNIQSLRIASWTLNNSNEKIPHKLLELAFPRYFNNIVTEVCEQNKIAEHLIYALIRSESFFDSDISSVVGAQGLTQLMKQTADEIAKKLNLPEDYNILDPKTNVSIGSYYLNSLIKRSDKNSELLALLSYNAGRSNVRNWLKDSKKQWESLGFKSNSPAGMSLDLFIETIPFSETREYGKKLISAMCMYGYLYYDILPSTTIERMFLQN